MINYTSTGRAFFGMGIIAYGIQQLWIRDFRPQILPGFPSWAHEHAIFPVLTGLVLVVTGLLITGIGKFEERYIKKLCFYLGCAFLTLIVVSHIPYLLFVYPHKLSHLGSWGDALKALAFSGGAFVMAGSFPADPFRPASNEPFSFTPEKITLLGKVFYCTTIILFGCNHFVYDISGMVPRWFGMPTFWSLFGGAALILAGTAILFDVLLKPAGLLLALMLFLWFVFLHVPNAIQDPYAGRGNKVVSAFDALLFCGVALVLSGSKRASMNRVPDETRRTMHRQTLHGM